ncbi:MAG: hypothetical protein GY759_03515 [Chloroflexi bacterium]|nr:hypothetical protein [Chloroflexota bacterium]
MVRQLKGDPFTNRYRITGTLKTLSPLHVGTGEANTLDVYTTDELKEFEKNKIKAPEVSRIMTDHVQKPLIPGSTLRGVMRHWLLSILQGFGNQWAAAQDYEDKTWLAMSQQLQINRVREEFSYLELLFGTPFNAGKVEVWDAECLTEVLKPADQLLHWNGKRLTYVDTSVVIDPNKGTAVDKLLFKTEIVPPGVEFALNIIGQNISDLELGLILLALQGFNSAIYPIHVGARSGRGYGRVRFTAGDIYLIEKSGLEEWVRSEIQSIGLETGSEQAAAAGYYALPKLDQARQKELIVAAKSELSAGLKE